MEYNGKIKVLEINAVYGHGSTGTIVKDIESFCISSGLECFVASPDSNVFKAKNGYLIGNILDHKIHALLSRINGKQGYYSYFSTVKLLKYIDSINPNIVHLHNLHSNYIHLNMLLRYLAKKNIKTFITLHDCWFYTGGCFHYTTSECFKWLEACGDCPKKMLDIPAYLKDSSSQILQDRKKFFLNIPRLYVVGVSDWISQEAKRSFFKNVPVVTIHNGIDFNIFKPTISDIRIRLGLEGKFIILGPASKWLLPENKYILDFFIKKMKKDELLVLFGATDCNIKIADNVKLLGFTKNRRELAEIYTLADVFVNTTREDSLSLINVEAQACGTPVVTFNATGPKETVDEINSFSVPVGDSFALYEKIQFIKYNMSDCVNSESIKFVKSRFDRLQTYQQYINLYKTCSDENNK